MVPLEWTRVYATHVLPHMFMPLMFMAHMLMVPKCIHRLRF